MRVTLHWSLVTNLKKVSLSMAYAFFFVIIWIVKIANEANETDAIQTKSIICIPTGGKNFNTHTQKNIFGLFSIVRQNQF